MSVVGPFFTLERLWPETVEPLDEDEDEESDSVSAFFLLDLDFFLLFRERPFLRRLCSEEASELEELELELELGLGLLRLLLCLLRLFRPLRKETSAAEAERRMLVPLSGCSS